MRVPCTQDVVRLDLARTGGQVVAQSAGCGAPFLPIVVRKLIDADPRVERVVLIEDWRDGSATFCVKVDHLLDLCVRITIEQNTLGKFGRNDPASAVSNRRVNAVRDTVTL